MKIPKRIEPFVEAGLVDTVMRQLMSGKEIWSLYRSGKLHPAIELTGRFEPSEIPADVGSVMRVVDDALKEEAARQRYRQESGQR